MEDEKKSTPRPWRLEGPKFCDLEDGDGEQMVGYSVRGVVGDDDSAWVADVHGEHVGIPSKMSQANAELIVKAVNAYREWQTIETAPKDGTRILLCDYEAHEGSWDCDPAAEGGQCWRMAGFDMERVQATHWMPLPDPPEQPVPK